MKRIRTSQSAHTLIAALGAMALLAVLLSAAASVTQNHARLAQRSRVQQTAIEVADGSLEVLFSGWRKLSSTTLDGAIPLSTTAFATIPVPTQDDFPSIPNFRGTRLADTSFVLSNFKVEAVDPLLAPMVDSTAPPSKATGAGGGITSYYYLASADVTLPSLQKNARPLTAKVRRVFEKRVTSPWTSAVFYQNDLEIHPNNALTLNGWVHTNGSLFTGSDKLTLTDRMTFNGAWNIGWKPGDPLHTGTPVSPIYPAALPPGADQNWAPFGWYMDGILNTTDANLNNDSFRELIERPDTSAASPTDPLSDKRYYNQADVRIQVGGSNNVTIWNRSGVQLTAASTGASKTAYDTFTAAIQTDRRMQDNREVGEVRVIDIDIARIRMSYPSLTASFNGVIYVSDTSASPTNKRAVRIINGQSLPTGGLTVVSDNPVYIKGNFNTGGDLPPSNLGDPTLPTVAGYTRQPAAVVGDAVTVLSKAWSDSNSSATLSNRVAAPTTVNAAILAGNVPTTSGSYSGGAENFVRHLEDWSGARFTYYGSMVQLYESKQAIGTFGKANVYTAPFAKNWYFDTSLQSKGPPGKLVTISYLQQQRWFVVY